MTQKIRRYWRLVFLVPVIVCILVVEHLARSQLAFGDQVFSAIGVCLLAVHLFRFAIGGALVVAEGADTPLRMATPAAPFLEMERNALRDQFAQTPTTGMARRLEELEFSGRAWDERAIHRPGS